MTTPTAYFDVNGRITTTEEPGTNFDFWKDLEDDMNQDMFKGDIHISNMKGNFFTTIGRDNAGFSSSTAHMRN